MLDVEKPISELIQISRLLHREKLEKYGVEVKCLEEQLDTNDPASMLLRAIKLTEPEMDKDGDL